MSYSILGWLLVVTAIVISAPTLFPPLPSSWLGDRLKLAKGNESFGDGLRATVGTWVVAAAIFVAVAGVGAASSYLGGASEATVPGEAAQADDEMLVSLANYTKSIARDEPAAAAPEKLLPDVNTMIEQLAARLATAPGDVKGWRMLGWSYSQTGRYEQAAAAYAKAMDLDPGSADLKRAYEEANARASQSPGAETAAEAAAPREGEVSIRSMVDSLATRLETSPRDVEGWTRLMRSRVVLGEKEVAATALGKALDVFKDDSAASAAISAAAVELGLKAE
jgi:cytochrome c-type biogenesis protein CcmH